MQAQPRKQVITTPTTQSIKYAGSKLKLLPDILRNVQGLEITTVLDGFSGSTRVSQAFAQSGFRVTSNDVAIWSETFAKAYLLNTQAPSYYQEMIDHLNHAKAYEGWFTEHYGGDPDIVLHHQPTKRPFQRKNTLKLDGIRDEIDRLNLSDIEKAVALTSLILALDTVDNTLGHYAGYLAEWSPRSYNDIILRIPKLFINPKQHDVIRGDIFDTLRERQFDLAYFDPPYGSNNDKMPPSRVRYNSYYHLWTTVILNDKPPLFGKANRREDSRDECSSSVFEEFRKDEQGHFIAMQAIKRLITETNAQYILLSYSSGGRATREELYEILCTSGTLLRAEEITYKKNVMSNMRWTNEWTTNSEKHCEYLFLLEK